MKNKLILNIIIVMLLSGLIYPGPSLAYSEPKTYPKLANYFLKWTLDDYDAKELAKWDLLILDMETQKNSRAQIEKIRELNPDIMILAYITSQEIIGDIYSNPWSQNATLRKKLVDNIDSTWWLKNKDGNKLSFWPGTYMLNVTDGCGQNANGQRWNEYLPEFVNTEILSSGLWDGVFYDNIWGDVTWVQGDMDVDRNGTAPNRTYINQRWAAGTKKMLDNTRRMIGDKYIILGNGMVYDGYQPYLNGMMFESFPSPWENGGTWAGSMSSYDKIKATNKKPNISVLNTYYKDRNNHAKMRFGLTSTLLNNNGYFSFDYDNTSHGQTWWYDEYDVNLGTAQSAAYNLLDKENSKFKAGLWRRDFENGVSVTNSTSKEQKYIFSKEEFEKINGTQDRSVNDGARVNFIKLKPNDGVVLLRRQTELLDNVFNNGDFLRIFDTSGRQVRNGFFSYASSQPGNAQVLVSDFDNDGQKETLSNVKGAISIYRGGQKIKDFKPYDSKFSGEISFAVADLDGDGSKEIITGAGYGGGPHVRIFSSNLKLIGSFMAYDPKFRGGITIAVAELTGDNQKEIITGAGPGGGPEVRVFSRDGKIISKFYAYDKNFKGGINVAGGDVNSDNSREIVVSPKSGNPEVKIFNRNGKELGKFLAYDATFKSGFRVMVYDINTDGVDEIITGASAF